MRYYGEDYKQHTINVLDSVRDAAAGSDYAQIIRNTDVSTNNGTLKIECVQAGSNAYAQVDLVREKLNKLVTILRPFYDGVDETATAAFTVSPNPAQGCFMVEGQGRLTVTNILGQPLLTKEIDGKETIELPHGLYLVILNGITQKIVVE